MSKKTPEDALAEVADFLKESTDVYHNPAITVRNDTSGFAESIIISSKSRFLGLMAEDGTGGGYLVIKVFYGIENDLKSREDREADGSRITQGNEYYTWSHDGSFFGKLGFRKRAAEAEKTPDRLKTLLDEWFQEITLY